MSLSKGTVLFGLTLAIITFFNGLAYAESWCYGVYTQSGWAPECGEVPAPPSQYSVPTIDSSLNQNDKLYLCSLVQLSNEQCAEVQFSGGAGFIGAKDGIVQSGFDVRMEYHGKWCKGYVSKVSQSDNTWILSSPTSLSFMSCEIPRS